MCRYLINPDEELSESWNLQRIKKISWNVKSLKEPHIYLLLEDQLVYIMNEEEISCFQVKNIELASTEPTYYKFDSFLGFDDIKSHVSFTGFK